MEVFRTYNLKVDKQERSTAINVYVQDCSNGKKVVSAADRKAC